MKIKVTQPFSLRLNSDAPTRDFPCGEHSISDDEYRHWFMQACLKSEEPRAILLFEELVAIDPKENENEDNLVPLTHSDFNKMTVADIKSIATHVGISFDAKVTKEQLITLLLEGQEGKHLVKDGDSYTLA